MKKKIYYTVDVEFHDGDYELGPTGHKSIMVYEVENVGINVITDIDCQLSDNSEQMIQNYLDDNGMGDEEYEFQLL